MQIRKDRRALHRIPELDKRLPKTMAYIKEALAPLNCQVFVPAEGSLCAWFNLGAEAAIAFRADADALPISEKNGHDYTSQHPGCMHACGHDGHMAILLELARRISGSRGLKRNILLVFQCAEETTGGAKEICQAGVFEKYKVEAIFGLHLWPGLPAGTVASRKNELMCRSSELTVEITGRSSHIAKADQGLDALAAGVDFYSRVRALEASLPENVYRVLNFGKLESGTVRNAISAKTRMEGTMRVFQEEVFEHLRQQLLAAAEAVEQTHGCPVRVHLSEGYPAVMNPPELYDRIRAKVPFAELDAPSMTAEDFSWYQKTLPGLFFFLGTGDTPALHTDTFDFDETILLKGADFFQSLAESYQ